jgi:hypothetical protein
VSDFANPVPDFNEEDRKHWKLNDTFIYDYQRGGQYYKNTLNGKVYRIVALDEEGCEFNAPDSDGGTYPAYAYFDEMVPNKEVPL